MSCRITRQKTEMQMAMTKPLSTILLALSSLFCCDYLSEGAEISIVDQSHEVANAQGAIGTTVDNRARFKLGEAVQAFTAGVSGKLTQVDVLINAWTSDVYFPLRIEIQPTDLLGRPYSSITPLVTGEIGLFRRVAIPEPTWMSVRFPMPGVSLTAGNVYAIVAHSDDADGYRWFGSGGDFYPRGNSHYRYNSPAINPPWDASFDPSFDFTFRTHMTIAVPEPSTWPLVGVVVYLATHRPERRRRLSAG